MMQGTLGRLPFAEPTTAAGTKGSFLSQKGFLGAQRQSATSQWQQRGSQSRLSISAPAVAEVDASTRQLAARRQQAPEQLQVRGAAGGSHAASRRAAAALLSRNSCALHTVTVRF